MIRFTNHFLLFLVSLLYVMCLSLNAQEPVPAEKSIAVLPNGVSIHQLDNGLQVLLIENRALPMVGVNVVVKTGSAYETFATSGMSHMLEHLMFNGTESRSQKELYDAVDMIGGYNNANTSDYFTNFMMVTPAEHIQSGMQIQADMLFNSVLPEDKFEKEKGIVLEEIARSLENADEQIDRNIRSILYPGHALSLPTLGTYATIESMSRDDVYEYYKNNYVPNNMLMSVIGNFGTNNMLSLIKEIYGKESPQQVAHPDFVDWKIGFEPLHGQNENKQYIYHRSYKGDKPRLHMFYALPPSWTDAHFILFDEMLSKIKPELVKESEKTFPQIDRWLTLQTRRSALSNYLQVSLTIDKQTDPDDLCKALNRNLQKRRFELAPESVQFLATRARTNFLKNVEKPHMFGIYNAYTFAVQGIEGVLASYSVKGYEPAAKDIAAFRLNTTPTIALHYPAVEESESSAQEESKIKMAVDSLSAVTLIAEQNTFSELLAIHFLVKHKAQLESIYGKDAAKILHDCLGQRLNSVENQNISRQFGLTYTVNDNPFIPMDNIYLHPDFSYIRAEGLADNLEQVIIYLKEQLSDFVPTREEFEKAMAKSKRPMGGMGSSQSGQIFTKTYKAAIYKEPSYALNSQLPTYENLIKFSRLFFHPSNMIISVVSPAMPAMVFDYFAWPTSPPPGKMNEIDKNPYQRQLKMPSTAVSKELEGGGERSFLFWGFVQSVEESDKAALKVLDLMLADYIIFDIREKQGRAYRMQAGVDVLGEKALFRINLGTRPENIDPLLTQMPGFFSQEVVDVFTEEDLKKSVNMYLGRMMFRRLSSINRAYYLGHSQYFHDDMAYDEAFLEKLKTVSLQDVKEAAIKYMQIQNPVQVVVR